MEDIVTSNKKTFFRYVIPSILSFALSGVYAIVDGFFVGNCIGDVGLSAINVAFPIQAMIQAVGTGIGMGGAVKYAITNAEGNNEQARKYIACSMWMMFIFSAVITASVFLNSTRLLIALGASGELITLGNQYIRVVVLATIMQILGTGLVPFMRNYGGSFWAMVAMISGFITNIVFDYMFVWVFDMGMYGASTATILGQCVTGIIAVIFCAKKKNITFKIGLSEVRGTLGQIVKIGLAPFGMALTPNISLVLINKFSAMYGGQEAIAIYACIGYIMCILTLILQGVGDGSQPLFSHYYGEGNDALLKHTKILAYQFAIALAIIGSVILFLFRHRVGTLFGASPEVNADIIKCMPIFLISIPFVAITRVATSSFYATEKSILSYIVTFAEPILLFIMLLTLPKYFGGQIMIWWSTVIGRIVTALIAVLLAIKNRNKKRELS